MLSTLNELVTTGSVTALSMGSFTAYIIAALAMGLILSFAIQFGDNISKSFAVTIALLPPVVCVVIMMVNGSIGTGIAVAGTFSLVRFRSLPGTAKEITAVFIAMAIGLACGMGNLSYALIFSVIAIMALLILENTKFGEPKEVAENRNIRITIPEDLDYTAVFDDLFQQYTNTYNLVMVKTTNLGSLFKLSYNVNLKNADKEKEFIDKLRVRNGNLEISCSVLATVNSEL